MVYKTSGVCSSAISFDIDDAGKVHDVKFQGGCSGNTQGVAKLIEGMDAKEAISRLEGIRCGFRPTSCPDQLSKALKQAFRRGIKASPFFVLHIELFCVSDIISVPFITQRLDISRKAVEVFVWNALALADNGHKTLSHSNQFLECSCGFACLRGSGSLGDADTLCLVDAGMFALRS